MPLYPDYNCELPPIKVVFRRLDRPNPPKRVGKYVWQVEAMDATGYLAVPVGLAWVSAFPVLTSLDYVLVPEQFRRKGVGKLLVAAIRERWPNVWITDPISTEGEALYASVHKPEAV